MATDRLEARLEAVEQALTDGETAVVDLEDEAAIRSELAAATDRLAELEDRVTELEAATQALRGYVGNVRGVNEAVERRADAALATAESLEDRVAALEGESHDAHRSADGPSPSRVDRDAGSDKDDALADIVERVRESL